MPYLDFGIINKRREKEHDSSSGWLVCVCRGGGVRSFARRISTHDGWNLGAQTMAMLSGIITW